MGEVRFEILRTLLSIRANKDYHLGIPKQGGMVEDYSLEGVNEMSLTRACLCVLMCLRNEKDWKVLVLVLEEVPRSLQKKGMLTRYGGRISPSHPLKISTPQQQEMLIKCS